MKYLNSISIIYTTSMMQLECTEKKINSFKHICQKIEKENYVKIDKCGKKTDKIFEGMNKKENEEEIHRDGNNLKLCIYNIYIIIIYVYIYYYLLLSLMLGIFFCMYVIVDNNQN